MSIEVKCLQCGTTHHVNNRLAGRRVRCPQCETAVHVPELDVATMDDATGDDVKADEAMEADVVQPVDGRPAAALPAAALPAATVPADTVNPARPAVPEPVVLFEHHDDDDEEEEMFSGKIRDEDELDMTPMVDVTFLLLIFFMVTAAFTLQKSIEMPRQQTDAPSTSVVEEEEEELDLVEVQIDEMGSFLVLAPDWEKETPGKQNLITALKEAIVGNNDGMRLIIKVHELAKLRHLVDCMDAGTIAGYGELEVTQVEEFD